MKRPDLPYVYELTVVTLVSSPGYSDPYIIVKYGQQEMYKTHFINKTLDPQWNCNATLSAPAPGVSIVLVSVPPQPVHIVSMIAML